MRQPANQPAEGAMDTSLHRFTDLFAQLGLASDEASIRGFIATHAPLAPGLALAEAPFWSASQAAFLREEIGRDADWAEVVDRLSLALREAGHRAGRATGPTGL
jgi:hypothetical protein